MNTTQQTADQFSGDLNTASQTDQKRQLQDNSMNTIRDPRRKSPFLASILSFLPGLGQVYVGYYRRGFQNILIFAACVSFLATWGGVMPLTPLVAFFMVFFWFYNVIDAARRASLFNLSLEGIEQIDLPDELTNKPLPVKGSYLLGGVMFFGGVIALSNTLFGYTLDWLEYWWPVAPIAFGAYLIYLAWKDSQENQDEGNETE